MFSTIRDNISPTIAAAAFVFVAGTVMIAALVWLGKRKNRLAA